MEGLPSLLARGEITMSKYVELTRNLASGKFEGQVKKVVVAAGKRTDELDAYYRAKAALARHKGVLVEHGTAGGDSATCADFEYGTWFKEGYSLDEDDAIYKKTRKARQKKTGE